MITFLHTAQANVKRFDDLVRKYDPDIEIRHFVNEDLLRFALTDGKANASAFIEEAEQVKDQTQGLIVCTCSSYGEACELVPGIRRIDKPAVNYLVNKYTRIGLAFTAPSTAAISKKLIHDAGEKMSKNIEVIPIDCSSCWTYFQSGQTDLYEENIARIIGEDQSNAEAIFLAQASMENAKNYLADFAKEVMASPEFGVRHYLSHISDEKTM